MPGLEERREALVDLIYDAVLDAPLWSRVLESIADLTGSTGGLIHGYCADRSVYTFHDLGRIDPDCKRRHELYHVDNPWRRSAVYPAGHLLRSDDFVALRTLKRSAFYSDVLAPQDIAHSLTAILAERPDFQVSINIERSEVKGPYGDEEIAVLRWLLPHLKRASEMRLRMHDYRAAAQAGRDTLDLLTFGMIALDQGGCVLVANETAEAIGRRGNWRFVRGEQPISGSPAATRELRRLVRDALQGGAGGRLWLESDRALSMQVSPARARARRQLSDAARSQVAVLVILADAGSALDGAAPVLAERHDLTPAEMRVAGALSRGESLNATAAELGIGLNTLKTHAKRVYAKTGVRSQAELIRAMIALTPAPFRGA